MDAHRRTLPLRRVAMMAALAALTLPAGQAQAAKKAKVKSPVITSVTPMTAAVGQTLTIKGSSFRRGKGRNSVGFKRDGAAVAC
jgi:ABC-type phosphate transport system substrate-binding protein